MTDWQIIDNEKNTSTANLVFQESGFVKSEVNTSEYLRYDGRKQLEDMILHGRFSDAAKVVNYLAQSGMPQSDVSFFRYRLALGRKDFGDATKQIALACSKNPCKDWLLEYAKFSIAMNHMARASELLSMLVKSYPKYLEGYIHLGLFMKKVGDRNNAASCFLHATRMEGCPDYVFQELSELKMDAGKYAEALHFARAGLSKAPNAPRGLYNIASAEHELGKFHDALLHYDRVLQIEPESAATWNNLGVLFRDWGRSEEAVECMDRATRFAPTSSVFKSNYLITRHYLPCASPESYYSEAVAYGNQFSTGLCAKNNSCEKSKDKIRVGYISGDFRRHAVGSFLDKVFLNHNRDKYSIHLYSNNPVNDALTERFRTLSDTYTDISSMQCADVAATIGNDKIDILVDLSGHSSFNRLSVAARKPAPVQMVWLGYFDTTGLPEMDYIIADSSVVTPADEKHFTESVLRMPDCFMCYSAPDYAIEPKVDTFQKAGSTEPFTFGCYNHTAKLNDRVVSCYAEILKRSENSQLLFKSKSFHAYEVRDRVIALMGAQGISSERILFDTASPYEEYLESYRKIDLALDPFPYTGGATTADSLWMGVPVLTLCGDRFVSRMSSSILKAVGLEKYITHSEAEYVEMAVNIASGYEKMDVYGHKLRKKVENSPFTDGKRFCESLEEHYLYAWNAYKKSIM
ncbi:MAG: tetratricopeptide repeat protein [Desulfovibrio sp.]